MTMPISILLISGGKEALNALQALAISMGLIQTFRMCVVCVMLWRALCCGTRRGASHIFVRRVVACVMSCRHLQWPHPNHPHVRGVCRVVVRVVFWCVVLWHVSCRGARRVVARGVSWLAAYFGAACCGTRCVVARVVFWCVVLWHASCVSYCASYFGASCRALAVARGGCRQRSQIQREAAGAASCRDVKGSAQEQVQNGLKVPPFSHQLSDRSSLRG